jgi:hypothetical protein
MSVPYLNNIDFNNNQALNMRLQNLATAPGSPLAGFVYYDTATGKFMGFGTGWVDLGLTIGQVNDAINAAIANLISSAPTTLDTLNELAAALGDDPNFATTIATAIAAKVDKVAGKQLTTEDFTTASLTKLNGIATGANLYTHPTTDGNMHVPATSTTNNLKVLKAGATAGVFAWGNVAYGELTGVPTNLVKKYSAAIGDGSATSIVVTHSLNTMNVSVTIRETASPYNIVYTDVQTTTVNAVTITFATALASGKYTVTVTG